jgi:hypothetical protein
MSSMPPSSAPPALVALLALGLAAAAGCTATPDLAPRPARLTPGGGPAGLAIAVTIAGDGFFPRAVQSASGGPASLDTTHRAWLDAVELADVTWVDAQTLRATVPAGLALGPHALTVENALGRRGTLAAAWTVIQPAVLALSATLAPAQASVGQPLALTVTAGNSGGAALLGLTVTVTPSGAGAVTGGLAGAPFDLAPGASRQLQLDLTASGPGPLVFGVAASGVEEASGRLVTGAASDLALLVQVRAVLTAALSVPSTLTTGAAFTVTMLVANGGEATALAVTPDPLLAAPDATGASSRLSGPTPASADVPGGGQARFTWSFQLGAAGTIRLRGGASGLDANDGGPVVAAPADSNLGSQLLELVPLATDPLGDGTPVAALAVRGGALYVGPSRTGSTFWQLDPATGVAAVLPVEIAVDTGPTPADNQAWRSAPPATTFGSAGCTVNSTACGPNDENGLGTLAAGRFSGADWLLYAPASDLKARYLYLASQPSAPMQFQAVDLSAVLPTTAATPTAVAFAPGLTAADDRVYVAFADGSSKKSPYLVALRTAPTAPWLDAASPGDVTELGASAMPGQGSAFQGTGVPRLDAMVTFEGALYLASGAGLLRSTVAVPNSYASSPSDWAVATPTAWSGKTSASGPASAGVRPADLAVPAMASFGACGGGPCLFLARNVVGTAPAVVPQLWACHPARTGDPAACDPGDWDLAAPNTSGDPALTQLDVPTNGAVSLLLATARYLYMGFDNAVTGVQLYRSEVVPSGAGDFRGRDGCLAGTAGCEGLGGNGFGSVSVTRLFDAKSVTAGAGTTLYLAAGDATAPLRLYSLPE